MLLFPLCNFRLIKEKRRVNSLINSFIIVMCGGIKVELEEIFKKKHLSEPNKMNLINNRTPLCRKRDIKMLIIQNVSSKKKRKKWI